MNNSDAIILAPAGRIFAVSSWLSYYEGSGKIHVFSDREDFLQWQSQAEPKEFRSEYTLQELVRNWSIERINQAARECRVW